ncbi:MAG: hypothetical protein EBS54_09965 [Betaproteobacteria bacterium]|nr:hypothetical protein [Betaproteobacteria bacterium]NBT83224.1 hypothetical protein [Betaproteobacteria bacterium]
MANAISGKGGAMNKMNGYAANLSPVSLVLPEYERFQIDGQRIGERTVAMAAKLPQPEPAAIIAISRAASSMPTISQPSSQQA